MPFDFSKGPANFAYSDEQPRELPGRLAGAEFIMAPCAAPKEGHET
jgi:hypothetical protein